MYQSATIETLDWTSPTCKARCYPVRSKTSRELKYGTDIQPASYYEHSCTVLRFNMARVYC